MKKFKNISDLRLFVLILGKHFLGISKEKKRKKIMILIQYKVCVCVRIFQKDVCGK